MRLEPTETGFQIDAADLAPLLGLAPQDLRRLMREGQVTSICEAGQDEDEGRHRITFRHGPTRVRLTVDMHGEVLLRTRTHVAPQPGALVEPDAEAIALSKEGQAANTAPHVDTSERPSSFQAGTSASDRIQLPHLVTLAEMVEDLHTGDDGNPEGLSTILRRLIAVASAQGNTAEHALFYAARTGAIPDIEASVDLLRAKHAACDRDIQRIRDITNEFTLPAGACTSWKTLYSGLSEFINDLTHRVQLE